MPRETNPTALHSLMEETIERLRSHLKEPQINTEALVQTMALLEATGVIKGVRQQVEAVSPEAFKRL